MVRRTLLNGIAWLLPLILLAGGCSVPAFLERHDRMPSPTSVLEDRTDHAAHRDPSSEDIHLMITEVRSSGRAEGAYAGCESNDWFELYNAGSDSMALSRCFVTNDGDKPNKHRLPEMVLDPGQYVAICCCEHTEHPSVPMGIARKGEKLMIFGEDKRLICELEVPPLDANISWAYSNGSWGYCTEPTPGSANGKVFVSLTPVQAETFELSVSELLIDGKYAKVTPDGAYSDFVELHNDSDGDISLKNWFLSDSVDDLKKWAFPEMTVSAGEYVLILLGGKDKISQDGWLQADFSVSCHESIVLYNANALRYSVFDLPETIRSDVSVGANGAYFMQPTPGRENAAASYTVADEGKYAFKDVFISEACAYAGSGNNDWIELYNASDKTVSLTGWELKKDRDGEKALPLSGQMKPGEYAVFETTAHKERQSGKVGPFGLSMGGDTLYLLDDSGALRDEFSTGALVPGVSSGRLEGNGNVSRVFFTTITKGERNSDRYALGYAKAPVFSETRLYQTNSFSLALTSGENATIRYTTDGSEPTAASTVYSKPIIIEKNTIIRAYASQNDMLDSEIVTYSFLFEEPHQLPVICLSFAPEDKEALWSGVRKVFDSKQQRKGFFSYYEDGVLSTQFPADFKSKGASTLGYSQASLSIHLKGKYGQGSVTYPFFKEYGWAEYTSFNIRNSGQDGSHARIRDSYADRLCMGLNVDVVATRPVVVYINGEYYGLYDLNEDQNDDYLNNHYGVSKDDVEIIRFNWYINKGTDVDWQRVINYAKTKDMSNDAVYEEFTKWVAPDYFLDYLVCSMYLCNRDMANQKYWHTTDNAIRWRPIFYDFDYGMGFKEGSVKQSIIAAFFNKRGTPTATSRIYTYISVALVNNPGWRQRFIERYVELTVTAFAPDRAIRILNELRAEMEPEMKRHIDHWHRPGSYTTWKKEMEYIQKWMEQRPTYALSALKKYFELDQSYIDELVAKYTPAA